MIPLAVALTFMVLLLSILVLGLLRSHADILRALHSLGAGIGDPVADEDGASESVPLTMGPTLPAERRGHAPDLVGTTVDGDARSLSTTAADLAFLAFLSGGCSTCADFWNGLSSSALGLPPGTRVVIVTQGPDLEQPSVVARLAPPDVEVLMSTQAWIDYEVPGAPYFALVDGGSGRRVGEGLASTLSQVAGLIRRVVDDIGLPVASTDGGVHLDGPEREEDNDRALLASGIRPGDASLYPSGVHQVRDP